METMTEKHIRTQYRNQQIRRSSVPMETSTVLLVPTSRNIVEEEVEIVRTRTPESLLWTWVRMLAYQMLFPTESLTEIGHK